MSGIAASKEAQIAGMLSMFEYLNYHMGDPGTDFRTLINDAEAYLTNISEMDEEKSAMLQILNEGLNNIDGLGDLRLVMSDHGGGIEADAFVSDGGDAYVAYRGTGDGKWIDNGRGMTAELTPSQSQASSFYDRVAEQCGLDENSNVIVTGHSKGGNNAQAAALNAKHRRLIDKCFSFDGQGMSEAAIKRYSSMPGYEEQIRKMYGISGKDDAVNELGIKVIPDENSIYIETNADIIELGKTHAIEYLYQREDGTFGWTLNNETSQGELGRYAHRLSEILMSMPEEIRESCAVALMQLIEFPEGMMVGFNGDHASWSDMSSLLHYGLPAIIYSIIGTKEGQEALCEILKDEVGNLIGKYDVWEIVGHLVGAVMVSPILLPLMEGSDIGDVTGILAGVALVVDTLAVIERLGEILEEIGQCIQECLNAIGEFFEQIGDWVRHKVTGRPMIDSAEFSVHVDTLYHTAEELGNMKRMLQRAASGVNRVKRSLPMRGIAAGAVKMQLNYVTVCVNQVSNRADMMERALDQTAGTYEQYERRIAANV